MIYKLRDLLGVDDMGGTMRLGSYACRLAPDSRRAQLYGEATSSTSVTGIATSSTASTRRRSTDNGLEIVGRSLDGKFVEIVELPAHPVVRRRAVPPGVQVEAAAPHPLFAGFVEAATQHKIAQRRARARPATGG